ncbi:MAG TPA: hypothetical protein VFZ99_04745 [Terriglobales bacterium]
MQYLFRWNRDLQVVEERALEVVKERALPWKSDLEVWKSELQMAEEWAFRPTL